MRTLKLFFGDDAFTVRVPNAQNFLDTRTNLTRLTNSPANIDAPVWSPDCKRIAFASDRDGSSEIYVMNADGTNVVRRHLLGKPQRRSSWSADGNRIVVLHVQQR
jgi:Tol biopolymer transport system component